MKPKNPLGILPFPAIILAGSFALFGGGQVQASIWNNTTTGGNWSDNTANGWNGTGVPNGTTAIADFSTLDITATNTVHLNGTGYQVNKLLFGDIAGTSGWVLDNNADSLNILTLGGTTPTIQNNVATTISAQITGSDGLTKTGTGTLTLSSTLNNYTGGTVVKGGTLSVSGTLATGSNLSIGSSALGGTGNLGTVFDYTRASALTLGDLTFTGGLGLLRNTATATNTLTFNSLTVNSGAMAVVSSTVLNNIAVSTGTTNELIHGLFIGAYVAGSGANFGVVDVTTKKVRAMNYATGNTDNAVIVAGGTEIAAANAGKNIQLTGSQSAQSAISVKSLFFNAPTITLNMAASSTLTISGGMLNVYSGGTAPHYITGGAGALIDNNGVELDIRTGRSGGTLTISIPIQGTGGLTVSSQSTAIILSAANTYSGDTTAVASFNTSAAPIAPGVLRLDHNLALQNSALNTSGGGSFGLTVTTPTFGGLKGSRDLAAVISSGYTSVTALTLNPSLGVTNTYSGVISNASMTLTKTGAGTQVFTGINTYGGLTDVQVGELDLNTTGGQSIAGNLTVSGGTAKLLQADQINSAKNLVVSGGIFSLQGFNQTVANVQMTGGSITGSGGILTSSNAFDVQAGAVSAKLGGGVGMNKTGAGTVTLTGANTYTELTTVSVGELDLNTTGSQAIAGNLTVSGGTAKLLQADQINSAKDLVVSSGILNLQGYNQTMANVQMSGGSITGSGGILTSSNAFDMQAGSASAILDGSVGLNKTTGGTVTLSGANTYTGATAIDAGTLSAGNIVVAGGSSNLGNATSAVTLGSAAAQGTLSYTGNSATYTRGFTIGGAGGGRVDVTTSGQTLSIATNDVTGSGLLTIGGAGNTTVESSITHTGGLTKVDAGTLTLNNTNTYSGLTTISGGAIVLGSGGSIPNTTGVSLGTSGNFDVSAKGGYTVTALTGSGSVTGALTVSTTLAIGNSPGTVDFSSNLTLGSGTSYNFDVVGGTTGAGSADLGNVAGTLSLGGATLNLTQLGTYTPNEKFTLFSYQTGVSGTFAGLANMAVFNDVGSNPWQINYNDTAGTNGGTYLTNVTLTAVPETSAAVLGALGMLALLRRRRA